MNVLMIAPEPVLEPRGTPISVYQRLQGLAALGHRIDLATYHLGEDADIPGVTFHRIPSVPFVKQIKVGPSWQKILLDLLLLGLAVRLLMARRYDVIHSHEEAGFFAPLLAFVFRTRHLYDMHSSLPRQLVNFNFGAYRPIVWIFERLERWAIKTCDAVITIGSDLERYVKQINPDVKQVMIENLPVQVNDSGGGIAAEQVRAQLGFQDKRLVVYTGTFERYQGVDLLIESARILRNRHPNVVFVLVGGKPEQIEHWKNQVQMSGLGAHVRFMGTVPVTDVHAYLEMADILVSPRTEGLSVPLKIYTYLHAAKPIVATDIVAHTLVLDASTAVLVSPSGEALAAGIERLIDDPALQRRLSTQARAVAEERYSRRNYLTKLDQIYQVLGSAVNGTERPAYLLKE